MFWTLQNWNLHSWEHIPRVMFIYLAGATFVEFSSSVTSSLNFSPTNVINYVTYLEFCIAQLCFFVLVTLYFLSHIYTEQLDKKWPLFVWKGIVHSYDNSGFVLFSTWKGVDRKCTLLSPLFYLRLFDLWSPLSTFRFLKGTVYYGGWKEQRPEDLTCT